MVVSVKERRGNTAFYEGQGDERKRTTDDVSKATSDDTKTGVREIFRDENSRGTCLLLEWYPV